MRYPHAMSARPGAPHFTPARFENCASEGRIRGEEHPGNTVEKIEKGIPAKVRCGRLIESRGYIVDTVQSAEEDTRLVPANQTGCREQRTGLREKPEFTRGSW